MLTYLPLLAVMLALLGWLMYEFDRACNLVKKLRKENTDLTRLYEPVRQAQALKTAPENVLPRFTPAPEPGLELLKTMVDLLKEQSADLRALKPGAFIPVIDDVIPVKKPEPDKVIKPRTSRVTKDKKTVKASGKGKTT